MAKAINKLETISNKASKLSGSGQVIEFINSSKHPLKKGMEALRAIILNANKEITEHIKWNAPSFCFNGDDRVTFNLHRNEYILVVFHRGAKVKASKAIGPMFTDTTGLLEWISNDRAIVKLYSTAEVNEKKSLLKKLVNQWIISTSE